LAGAGALGTAARGSASTQIALGEDGAVVDLVAGEDVGDGADAEGDAGRHSGALPCLLVEPVEQRQVAAAEVVELVEQLGQRPPVGFGGGGVELLVHPGQRCGIAASDVEGAVAEYPLGVDHVADHVAHRPLAGGVAVMLALGREVCE
jgi:hypothetical protein